MSTSDERTRARLDFLEHEARDHPRRHAARLLGLALVGYLYPVAILLLTFGLVLALLSAGPAAWDASDTRAFFLYLACVAASVGLAAVVLRTFWVSPPTPTGQSLRPGEAAPLRAMIEDVRATTRGPAADVVFIDWSLNASVTQRRRFGLWGPRRSYLTIGMPLLIALTPVQLRVVLAHEFGHLRKSHASFTSWIYRINRTWESLAAPFQAGTRVRRWVMGWFVERYGEYFARTTLAVRRLHEYDADRHAAEASGRADAARTLVNIAYAGYRMETRFWPAIWREAGHEPLPPADILSRVDAFLRIAPPPDTLAKWIDRERRSRTPVTSVHPCLADRLRSVGCDPGQFEAIVHDAVAHLSSPDDSALSLLDAARARLWPVSNAAWKALAIQRWRMEHAYARHLAEKAAAGQDPAWESIRVRADYAPHDEAESLLRSFLADSPGHAGANFSLGRLLLDHDDDQAARHLETALASDSEFIGPSLHLLLEHYRDAGRDHDADPILARLRDHERALAASKKERLRVGRSDRFLPHGMPDADLAKVRRVLNRYPRIRSAYLARKHVRLFTDKPSYLLAVDRHATLAGDSRRRDRAMADAIASELGVPCAVVMLRWTSPRLRSRLRAVCPDPVFFAPD